jgi:SsrA-binding protein
MKIIAQNKKARFDYQIIDEFEAGIVLIGSEVKSLKCNSASVNESFISQRHEELWINNMHVPIYGPANKFNHSPTRRRKLLLHKRQIKKIIGTIKIKGLTLVVLSIYVNDKGLIKLKIATAKGKKKYDKREDIKTKEWERRKAQQYYSN